MNFNKNMGSKERIKDFFVCLRVAYGKHDDLSNMKTLPSNKHLYLIPTIHSYAPVLGENSKSGRTT